MKIRQLQEELESKIDKPLVDYSNLSPVKQKELYEKRISMLT